MSGVPNGTPSARGNRAPRPLCSHCGALTTPLWRTGPAGPKSLCNKCGLAYRKGSLVVDPSSLTGLSSVPLWVRRARPTPPRDEGLLVHKLMGEDIPGPAVPNSVEGVPGSQAPSPVASLPGTLARKHASVVDKRGFPDREVAHDKHLAERSKEPVAPAVQPGASVERPTGGIFDLHPMTGKPGTEIGRRSTDGPRVDRAKKNSSPGRTSTLSPNVPMLSPEYRELLLPDGHVRCPMAACGVELTGESLSRHLKRPGRCRGGGLLSMDDESAKQAKMFMTVARQYRRAITSGRDMPMDVKMMQWAQEARGSGEFREKEEEDVINLANSSPSLLDNAADGSPKDAVSKAPERKQPGNSDGNVASRSWLPPRKQHSVKYSGGLARMRAISRGSMPDEGATGELPSAGSHRGKRGKRSRSLGDEAKLDDTYFESWPSGEDDIEDDDDDEEDDDDDDDDDENDPRFDFDSLDDDDVEAGVQVPRPLSSRRPPRAAKEACRATLKSVSAVLSDESEDDAVGKDSNIVRRTVAPLSEGQRVARRFRLLPNNKAVCPASRCGRHILRRRLMTHLSESPDCKNEIEKVPVILRCMTAVSYDAEVVFSKRKSKLLRDERDHIAKVEAKAAAASVAAASAAATRQKVLANQGPAFPEPQGETEDRKEASRDAGGREKLKKHVHFEDGLKGAPGAGEAIAPVVVLPSDDSCIDREDPPVASNGRADKCDRKPGDLTHSHDASMASNLATSPPDGTLPTPLGVSPSIPSSVYPCESKPESGVGVPAEGCEPCGNAPLASPSAKVAGSQVRPISGPSSAAPEESQRELPGFVPGNVAVSAVHHMSATVPHQQPCQRPTTLLPSPSPLDCGPTSDEVRPAEVTAQALSEEAPDRAVSPSPQNTHKRGPVPDIVPENEPTADAKRQRSEAPVAQAEVPASLVGSEVPPPGQGTDDPGVVPCPVLRCRARFHFRDLPHHVYSQECVGTDHLTAEQLLAVEEQVQKSIGRRWSQI